MNYESIYCKIISHRKENPIIIGYKEKHHIVPRSLGGGDDKENIVELTAKEHYIVHLLLSKMYETGSNQWHKMIRAFMMMSMCNSPTQMGNRYTGRIHEMFRLKFSETMRYLQSGDKNSSYGTKWIFSIENKINMKVPKDHVLSDGWFEGRVIDFDGIETLDDVKMRKRCRTKAHHILKKAKSSIHIDHIIVLYNEYVDSGLPLTKYAKKINKPHSTMSIWFRKHIPGYEESISKPISCKDQRRKEAILLYEMYISGEYKSLRDFKNKANIKVSIMTMSKWFSDFIPIYKNDNTKK